MKNSGDYESSLLYFLYLKLSKSYDLPFLPVYYTDLTYQDEIEHIICFNAWLTIRVGYVHIEKLRCLLTLFSIREFSNT